MIDDAEGLPDYETPTPEGYPDQQGPLRGPHKLPSRKGDDEDCAIPVRAVDEAVNAIVCPEQTGATTGCGTCGLCWGAARNIAFLEH